MKRVITLFAVLLMGWSVNAWSFACKTANGTAIPIGGGSAKQKRHYHRVTAKYEMEQQESSRQCC